MRRAKAIDRARVRCSGGRLEGVDGDADPTRPPRVTGVPTQAEYRRQADRRNQTHTAAVMALVATLSALVFWWVPVPSASDLPSPSLASDSKVHRR